MNNKKSIIHSEVTKIPIWLIGLCILLLILYGFQSYSKYLSARASIGIVVFEYTQPPEIAGTLQGSPARKAGIPVGGRVVSVDGRPVDKLTDLSFYLKSLKPGTPVTLGIVHKGRIDDFWVTPGVSVNYQAQALNFLILVTYVLIGLVAYRVSSIQPGMKLFTVFAFIVALDTVTYVNVNFFLDEIFYFFVFRQGLAALQFALVFHLFTFFSRPVPWARSKWFYWGWYPLVLAFHLLVYFAASGVIFADSWLSRAAEFVFSRNIVFVSWGGICIALLFYQYRRAVSKMERLQIKWVALSVMPWVILQSYQALFIDSPWLFSFSYFIADEVSRILFPIGILFAMFRNNLLDARELISKQLFFSIISLIVLASLAIYVTGYMIEVGRQYDFESSIWLGSSIVFLLGVSFPYVRGWISRLFDRKAFFIPSDFGRNLRYLSERISHENDVFKIKEAVRKGLSALLGDVRVELFLSPDLDVKIKPDAIPCWMGEGNKEVCSRVLRLNWLKEPLQLSVDSKKSPDLNRLHAAGLELIFPLIVQRKTFGVLMIGKKPGRFYSRREIELLNLFSQNLASKLANVLLHSQLSRDELTHAYRRKSILEMLDKKLIDYRRHGQEFSLAMIDLDDFKSINDNYGHLMGDRILSSVARIIEVHLSENDFLGRYGGEEFLLIIDGEAYEYAIGLCERIRQAIARLETRERIVVTASFGLVHVTELSPLDDASELIAIADMRLYEAKKLGKNRIVH